jgi:thiol-disulfide isomerase/thioredoxin
MRFAKAFFCLFLMLPLLAACGDVMDDLDPSGSDERPPVQAGTTGPAVGQNAPDFTVSDSLGNPLSLSAVLPQTRGVVLYFTMWCPVCDSHMSHMQGAVIPGFPDVRFFAVDYVSGSVALARGSEIANGFAGSPFTVLVDTANVLEHSYAGTMGTTVVIDSTGVIRMNEDYKNGVRLQTTLAGLP